MMPPVQGNSRGSLSRASELAPTRLPSALLFRRRRRESTNADRETLAARSIMAASEHRARFAHSPRGLSDCTSSFGWPPFAFQTTRGEYVAVNAVHDKCGGLGVLTKPWNEIRKKSKLTETSGPPPPPKVQESYCA